MGVDIHVFTEIRDMEDNSNFINIDTFQYTEEGYYKNNAYEGRYSVLFDILQNFIPKKGSPENPSEVFKKEWEDYKGCGYGLNHIYFDELYDIWKREWEKDILYYPFVFTEFNVGYTLFPFVSELYKHLLSYKEHTEGSWLSNKRIQQSWKNYRIIYFFDR